MTTTTPLRRRGASGLLAGALLLLPLAGCSGTEPADPGASPEPTATETTAAQTSPTGTAEATETGGTGGGTDTATDTDVNCSGNSCSLTLTGDGAEADVLGMQVVLGGVENGRATFRVGNEELSCGQGESVSAGPLQLECTTVGDGTVTMTATLG